MTNPHIDNLVNAIISKVSGLIGSHNSSGSAHSSLFNGKEDVSNKVITWSDTPNNTKYPSEKLVKDTFNSLQSTNYSYFYYDTFNNDIVLSSIQKNQDILFSDNLTSKKAINHYGTIPDLVSGTDATYNISYDSTEQAYWFRGMCCITPLTGITENFTLPVDMKKTIKTSASGLIYIKEAGVDGFRVGSRENDSIGGVWRQNGSGGNIGISGTLSYNKWYRLKLTKNGTSISIKIYDLDDNCLSSGSTRTYEDGDNYYGIILDGYFKNVIAKLDR